ncbi:hypothetical protein HY639_02380 [Candidatus Woesearchaeota archaeon]|nr:hypothetical protein [Candidatus Woesearchaeota archaeon]
MGRLLDYLLGKGMQKVEVPTNPSLEEAWLSSNFTFRWLTRLHDWGVLEEDFVTAKKKNKTDDEVIVSLYKQLLLRHKKEPLLLQSLYYEMAMIEAERGRDPQAYLVLSQKSIMSYYMKTRRVRAVVIQNSGRDACPSCKKLDGWVMTLAQAEKKKPLPNKNCSKKHGKGCFCRCTYGPMTELR